MNPRSRLLCLCLCPQSPRLRLLPQLTAPSHMNPRSRLCPQSSRLRLLPQLTAKPWLTLPQHRPRMSELTQQPRTPHRRPRLQQLRTPHPRLRQQQPHTLLLLRFPLHLRLQRECTRRSAHASLPSMANSSTTYQMMLWSSG
jgi:hypothetical protein